jgi:ABC-2 type transport system permease protein
VGELALHRLTAVIFKEFKQLLRDPRTLAVVLGAPLVFIVSFGMAYGGEIKHIDIALANEDRELFSWYVVQEVSSSKVFKISEYVGSFTGARNLVESGRVYAAIIIPSGFSKSISMLSSGTIYLVITHSSPAISRAVKAEANIVMARLQAKLLNILLKQLGLEALSSSRNTSIQPVKLNIAEISTIGSEIGMFTFYSPLITGLTLQNAALTLAAISVAREKERRTIEQLIMTPITRFEFLMGKFIVYFIFSMLITFISFEILINFFSLVLMGSLIDIVLLNIIFCVGSLTAGMAISTFSKTQMQAIEISTFILLPSAVFCGAIIPPEATPEYARVIIYATPLYHYFDSMINIMVKGMTLADMPNHLIYLACYIAVTFIFSFKTFTKRIG